MRRWMATENGFRDEIQICVVKIFHGKMHQNQFTMKYRDIAEWVNNSENLTLIKFTIITIRHQIITHLQRRSWTLVHGIDVKIANCCIITPHDAFLLIMVWRVTNKNAQYIRLT